MRTKAEIMSRINELQAVSPSGAGDLFAELRESVESFFTSSAGMSDLVAEVIHHLSMDIFERKTKYEHQELVPPFPSDNFPRGYNDVTELFNGGGVWDEIFAVDLRTFPDTFIEEAGGGGDEGGSGESVLKNPIMEDWISRLPASKSTAIASLQTLGDFCSGCGLNYGIAQLFEDLGNRTGSPERVELADRVFITGGFKEIIEAYGLTTLIPSYLR